MTILPFQFRKLSGEKFLLTNSGGDFDFCSAQEFSDLTQGDVHVGNNFYYRLKSKNFIADSDLDLSIDLSATQLRSRKSFLNDFTCLHIMVLTARCNFHCDYCHASSSDVENTGLDMSKETAEQCINLIFQSPSPTIKIEFQGGEPLLNWETLVHSVLYAEKIVKNSGKNLEFVVCTNLTLLNKEKILFCKEHNIMISTSLDGSEIIQNTYRKPRNQNINGYETWLNNLELLRQEWHGYVPSALLTVTSLNITHLKEVIDLYISLGLESIFLRSLNPYGYARKNLTQLNYSVEDFVFAYKEALEYLIKRNLEGYYFPDYFTTLLLQRILTPFSTGFVDLQSPSGNAISGSLYDYTGEVFPSDEARMLARMGDKHFLMGNVHQNVYKEIWENDIVKKIVNSSCLETSPQCAYCAYLPYCGIDPVRAYLDTGDIFCRTAASRSCSMYKLIFDHLFELIYRDNQDVIDVFWSWITQRPLEKIQPCL